jgi:hypothetical protein
MVRVDGLKAAAFRVERLAVEQLEERCVLALPWPVDTASIVGIAATYGQFDDRTNVGAPGRIHFHEGIDILVGAGTKVYAIEDGTVAAVNNNPTNPYNSWVSVSTTADAGWNYVHITPDPALAKGAKVTQGKTLLGTVIAYPGDAKQTHLHLDAAGGPDPSFPTLLRPIDDPLARLDPLGDTIGPWVGNVYFMRGEDDNNIPHKLTGGFPTSIGTTKQLQDEPDPRDDHGYFYELDYSKAMTVGHYAPARTSAGVAVDGTSNIDIIADATDRITAGDPRLVGVRSIEFKAAGQLIGKTIPTVRPFDFVGEFVWDPNRLPRQQNYDSLRISDLTRVVYQNDATSPSTAHPAALINTFFHIVTNTDAANSLIDFEDRKRYWRSKVTQGSAWNDIGSTEAVNNAKGAYPDDYYTITITARDAAGRSDSRTGRVLLDNWVQSVSYAVMVDPPPPPGQTRVRVTGSQFTGNATVKVYLMTSNIADGQAITDHGTLLGPPAPTPTATSSARSSPSSRPRSGSSSWPTTTTGTTCTSPGSTGSASRPSATRTRPCSPSASTPSPSRRPVRRAAPRPAAPPGPTRRPIAPCRSVRGRSCRHSSASALLPAT